MKSVVLLSGGVDSATCLAIEVDKWGAKNVHAIAFNYGQKHEAELENAANVAMFYGVKFTILEIDSKIYSSSNSSLLQGKGEISHGKSYAEILAEKEVVDTYVPFRNGLMLSQAAAYAYSVGASYVVYGAHADDAAGGAYPDCTPEFYNSMSNAMEYGTGGKVTLVAPLLTLTKAQVVKWGIDLDVPYFLTRSCYESDAESCGTCATCIDRKKAFEENGMTDPIHYKEN